MKTGGENTTRSYDNTTFEQIGMFEQTETCTQSAGAGRRDMGCMDCEYM